MDVLGDEFTVCFDADRKVVTISKSDGAEAVNPLMQIEYAVLSNMHLSKAAEFLGERLLLPNPEMRELFKAGFHPDNHE
jgi:hypothetical protein